MAEASASKGAVCLCGCLKGEHRQGRRSCLRCDCDAYEPAATEPTAADAAANPDAGALHDMEVAFLAAERELKATRAVLAGMKHAAGLTADYPDASLPDFVATLLSARQGTLDQLSRLDGELAGAHQRLAEYDSGASVDRLLHDADAIDLDRVRHAAAGTRAAASILGDVLATAPRELELRAEADRLRAEAARVDDEIRRLVAGEPVEGVVSL